MQEDGNRKVRLYSYRKVWRVEKKIYAIQNIVLPFPVNPMEVLEFALAVGTMVALGELFPIFLKIPAILRIGIVPYIVVRYLMKFKLDGKNPVKYLMGLLPYLASKQGYMEHFKNHSRTAGKVRLNWNCSRRI